MAHDFVTDMPLRVSALRSLGAYMNVFSIESFVDELAEAAGADPVAFRLDHLDDTRARAVIEEAAGRFGWGRTLPKGRGAGFAFARYKNLAAFCALAVEVEVAHESAGSGWCGRTPQSMPGRSSTRTASATRSRAGSSRR